VLLDRELHRLGIEGLTHEQIAQDLGYSQPDDLLAAIGCGDIHLGKIVARLVEKAEPALAGLVAPATAVSIETAPSDEISVLGVSGLLTTLARCCRPAPGDPIVGYVTRGRGATIHRRDCPNVLRVADKERLIQDSWGQPRRTYPVSIRIRPSRS